MFKISKPFCRSLICSFVLVWIFLSLPQNSFAQNITLKFKDTPLKTILKEIQKQTKYRFVYNDNLVNVNTPVSVEISDQPVNKVLDQILVKNNIEYKIEGKQIVLSPRKAPVQKNPQRELKGSITGIVYGHELVILLQGVFLNSRNSNEYAQTDYNGKFELKSVAAGDSIRVSMIGMKVYDFVADSRNNYEIVLEEDVVQLENVIVTGYQTLSRERATGSFSKIREDKISGRVVTNLNQIFSGTTTGIEVKSNGALVIRGKASIYGDSNPLVVVDGFPIDGQFSSINPNECASVDIPEGLPLAASIYGITRSKRQ